MTTSAIPDFQGLARSAGLNTVRLPHLEEVDRRRAQLWGLSLLIALFVPAMMIIASVDLVDNTVTQALESRTVRLGLLGMLVVVLGYVAEREVSLRRLTALLVEERVLTSSLVSRVDELNLLLRATRAMNSALDLKTVLSQIAESAYDLLHASGVAIQLVDDTDPKVLRVVTTAGEWHEALDTTRGISHALDTSTPLRLSVPMEVRGHLLGTIGVVRGDQHNPFTEFHLRAVSVFAEAAAAAIGNARAYEQQLGQVATLVEQDRAKNEFLTLITHELRTPLTSIIGLMATMSRPGMKLPPEQVVEYAQIAASQGWRLDRLIQNLLESSKSVKGALGIKACPADVGQVVHDAVTGLQQALPAYPITVDAPIQAHRFVDVDAMQRIMDNLLSNASKYCPEGTPIEVILGLGTSSIKISVIDHGPGVDIHEIGGLFTKFTRGPDPFDQGGLGLGLFVVQALAEAHGGRVEVTETPGGGASFHVWLAARIVQHCPDGTVRPHVSSDEDPRLLDVSS